MDSSGKEQCYNTLISLITSLYACDKKSECTADLKRDNFSFLVVALVIWVTYNTRYFSYEVLNEKKIKLSIAQEVGMKALQVFINVYQDLTLNSISFWENIDTNTWDTFLYF